MGRPVAEWRLPERGAGRPGHPATERMAAVAVHSRVTLPTRALSRKSAVRRA